MSEPPVEPTSPPEAIRFGSTVESARAILAWMRQTDPTAAVRLELADDVKLLVFTSTTGHILSTGDYLALEDGYFVKYQAGGWLAQYGDGAAQELPPEPISGIEEAPQ